jgi:beta-galactosidase
MRIGVDYYPEHWPEERWPVDAQLMREANINVVRLAEFAWCKLEPQEEKYDFSWLDRALDILHKEGIQVVLGTPTATPPAWLHESYDIYPRDSRRNPLEFGTRLQRCLGHPIMRRYSRRITEKMAEHFADHPAVIGWQTDNEFEANLCYCEVCAARFRNWLRAKYGSLEELNKAWGTIFWSQEYTAWSQIPLPWHVRCGESHNPSLKLEYRRFASDTTVEFQREQIEIIRKHCPNHFITHNFMGLHDSMDYFDLGNDLDFVSWDNYPGGAWMQQSDMVSLPHSVMRGIKQKNFWIMEEQTHIIGWENMSRRPADGQSRMWAWQSVAHGADTVLFFRWRSCLYGTEQYWHGVINHDGDPRRRYREVQQFGKEMKTLSDELDGTTVKCEAGILNSYEQNWSMQIQPQTEHLGWWEQTRRLYNALYQQGVSADVVPIRCNLSQYKLVIVPGWYLLSEEDANLMQTYVQQGGTLLISPRTGVKNEVNACHAEPLPSLLQGMLGIEVDDYDPLGNTEYTIQIGDSEVKATGWADALITKGAETIGVWAHSQFSGEPAITRNRFGKGFAWYAGSIGQPDLYNALLPLILNDAEIKGDIPLVEGVDACWRSNDNARYLFLINTLGRETTAAIPAAMEAVLGNPAENGQTLLPPYGVGIYKQLK